MSGATDAYHEWLLSDTPKAVREGIRRRAAHAERLAHERDQVADWRQRILADPATSERLRAIAQQCQRELDRAVARDFTQKGAPDDLYVRWERERYKHARRAGGDHDYRYPARYVGAAAAAQPVPDEPPFHEWFRGDQRSREAYDTGLGR